MDRHLPERDLCGRRRNRHAPHTGQCHHWRDIHRGVRIEPYSQRLHLQRVERRQQYLCSQCDLHHGCVKRHADCPVGRHHLYGHLQREWQHGWHGPTDGNNPYNNGSTVTVLGNTGSLTQTNFAFAGWNTAANGSGTSYSAAATFTIGANTTLYAQWTAAVNGACGTAVGSSFSMAPSGAALCLTGSPSAVTSANGQYSWTCGGSGGGTSSGLCVASWAGTGVGPVTGSVSSQAPANNNNWVLNSASFSNTLPAPAPAGTTFPQGILSLQLSTGSAGSNASVTINYTQAVPAGSVYMKYGKSPDGYNCSGAACLQDHWYQMPANQAVFASDLKSVTLTIQDG